jgi:hypothetical protein
MVDPALIKTLDHYFYFGARNGAGMVPKTFGQRISLVNDKISITKIPFIHSQYNMFICDKVKSLSQIGLNFGDLSSSEFKVSWCKFTSLAGCPQVVGGDFDCSENKLTNLVGGPRTVGGEYNVTRNNTTLDSLEGLPENVDGWFRITWTAKVPLLRLVTLNTAFISIANKTKCQIIIRGYRDKIKRDGLSSKVALWNCQKELAEKGFEGNAKW